MEESITQVTEKKAVVREWSLRTQKAKGDNTRGIFTEKYGDIAHLITINVNEQLIQAMVRFWDPAYQCFTFNQEDMTPTIEEYAALLCIDNAQLNKIYVKKPKPMTFKKKALVQNHPDVLKRVDLFALAVYGLIVFPKVLGHIEVAVVDFFEKLRQGINPVPTILAETFKSLNASFLKNDWPKDVTEQHWVSVFQNLSAKGITWRAPWIRPSVLLYKCGNQDWVPLLGLWGGVGYAPLMVQRQFASQQFVPVTDGLAQLEFAFSGEGYMKKVRDTGNSLKKIYLMELAFYADTITQDYNIWRQRRVNSQQTSPTNYVFQNPFSEEMPSKLEVAKHEFECEKTKLLRDISSLQEENYQLKIDVQIEKSRTENVQKEAEITRRDLRDLHLENKKLRGTIRNSGLGKLSAEWKEEISNIKGGMEFWKAKAKEEEKVARTMIELRKKY
ncbi:uncharacterized protein LOC105784820 [Gossypium raimondii]|uniref:uncharacterized protein LOC105784820 n=1 Tax=Gossypium raimondii TaxID=29730 RepID=UPI00227CB85E|nr:uncharacterized protein LOC105784820 [Gossypium raimondii]